MKTIEELDIQNVKLKKATDILSDELIDLSNKMDAVRRKRYNVMDKYHNNFKLIRSKLIDSIDSDFKVGDVIIFNKDYIEPFRFGDNKREINIIKVNLKSVVVKYKGREWVDSVLTKDVYKRNITKGRLSRLMVDHCDSVKEVAIREEKLNSL